MPLCPTRSAFLLIQNLFLQRQTHPYWLLPVQLRLPHRTLLAYSSPRGVYYGCGELQAFTCEYH